MQKVCFQASDNRCVRGAVRECKCAMGHRHPIVKLGGASTLILHGLRLPRSRICVIDRSALVPHSHYRTAPDRGRLRVPSGTVDCWSLNHYKPSPACPQNPERRLHTNTFWPNLFLGTSAQYRKLYGAVVVLPLPAVRFWTLLELVSGTSESRFVFFPTFLHL